MKKILLLLSTLLVTITGTASEKQIGLEKIPSSANWIAHLDFEAFRSSEIGAFVLQDILKAPHIEQKMTGLKNAFGVDIDQLGFRHRPWIRGEETKALPFCPREGSIQSNLKALPALNDKSRNQKQFNGQKLYSAPKGAFSPLGPDTIIAATNEELLKAGLNARLGNNGQNRKENPYSGSPKRVSKKTYCNHNSANPQGEKNGKTRQIDITNLLASYYGEARLGRSSTG